MVPIHPDDIPPQDVLDKAKQPLSRSLTASTDPPEIPVGGVFEKLKREAKAHNERIKSEGQRYNALIQTLEATVAMVHYHTQETSIRSMSEQRMGGSSSTYRGGNIDCCVIELELQENIPVQKLKFSGWPHLEIGDTIRAYIFTGKKEFEKDELTGFSHMRQTRTHPNPPSYLLLRNYKTTERPNTIEKLRDGNVVAIYNNLKVKP